MASLSARVGSSLLGTFADRMQHMSHRFTLTARKSALLSGEPCKKSFKQDKKLSLQKYFTFSYYLDFHIKFSYSNLIIFINI